MTDLDDTHDRNITRWESYDGRQILIKDLEVRHLVNILNWAAEKNISKGRTIYSDGLCQLLANEAELRIMRGWAKDVGIPRKLDDGTWTVVNQSRIEKAISDIKSTYHRYKVSKMRKLPKDKC